jgi:type I restriction enzyme, S subunit
MQVLLKDIIRVHYGKALRAEERQATGLVSVYGSSGKVGHHSEPLFSFPSIIIGRKGSVGAITFAPQGGWVIDTAFYVEIIDTQKLDLRYLYYALRDVNLAKHTITTSIPGINRDDIYTTTIPLPPLAEQQRIAAILDKADALREKRRQALAKLDALLQSVFLEMFGDPVTNPKGWEIRKLKDLSNLITDGVHAKPNYTDEGVPFISVKDITTGRLYFDDCKFVSVEDHRKFTQRCKPELHDILYTKVGATYGRAVIVDTKEEFSLYVSVSLIKPKKEIIDPSFLQAVMNSPGIKRQADKCIKGIGVPDLHLIEIKNFLIPLPPRNVQMDFVMKVNAIYRLIEEQKTQLLKVEALFSSLQQRAFNGELFAEKAAAAIQQELFAE